MPARIIRIFETVDYDEEIRAGADRLSSGGIVVLPTETVYGAAGRLDRPDARRRLDQLRGKTGRPFTVHLARPDDAFKYLGEPGEFGRRAIRKLWPGPVGLIFQVPKDRQAEVAGHLNVAQGDLYDPEGAITLRSPDHLVTQDILHRAGGTIAMTAVGNGAGADFSSDKLAQQLADQIDLIFDAGPTRASKPSTLVKIGTGGYQIVRVGVYDERIIDKMLRTTLLFVCSGNTCRSPMAEAIARHLLAQKLEVAESDLEKKGVSVVSAGAFAMPGARATPQAVEAVRALGADLTQHRSRPLSVELIHQADRIYTMGRSHAMAVTALVPSAASKIATLDPEGDIDDPIGGAASLYQQLAGQLQTLIQNRLNELDAG